MVVILVVFLVGNLVCFLCLVITDSTQVMQATLPRVIWLLSSINIGYLRCEITGWGVCAVDGWTWPSVPPLG
jgi:hypothetical protein